MKDYDIGKAFRRIEDELIKSMIRNMEHHKAEETKEGIQWTQWQAEQLKALNEYRKNNKEKFSGRFAEINGKIRGLIEGAREDGNMEQEAEILEAIEKGARLQKGSGDIVGKFFRVNDRKLGALIKATADDFKKAEIAMLRMADDQYRKVIFDAQVYANAGGTTYEKAVDMATKDFLAKGINCIEYKDGSRHRIEEYADMAIKTAVKRAYLTGEGEKRKEWGISTVIVNKRGNPCPKCLPFCGKILIDDVWSGGKPTDGPYPLMSTAIEAGLYHPRCRDSHTTYFPGISTPPDDKYSKKEIKKIEDDYRAEQKEQYAKRQEEKFGRLAEYSLDKENQKKYKLRAEEWSEISNAGKHIRNPVAKDSGSGIMISGARITNIFSREAYEFAEMYYKEIRSFSTDAKKIAKNLDKSEDDIRKVKAYLFEDNSLYDPDSDTWHRFDPDCAIAQSWQRLMLGKNIKPHDRTLIEHELLEMQIKKDNPGIDHRKAHELATEKYDYPKEAIEYYGNLEKYQKDRK